MLKRYLNFPVFASSSAIVTSMYAVNEVQKLREKEKSDHYDRNAAMFESAEILSLYRHWRHLKDEEVDIERAFEIGKAKLPLKPHPSPTWAFLLGSSPSIYEKERQVELSKMRLLLSHFVGAPGFKIIKENADYKGCQIVFSYNPTNVHFLNKLLATVVGALSNDEGDADDIIRELKNYEAMSKLTKRSDKTPGRAYSRELLKREELCDLCKLALPDDERCNALFRTKRAWDHRQKTELLLEEIAQRNAERDAARSVAKNENTEIDENEKMSSPNEKESNKD